MKLKIEKTSFFDEKMKSAENRATTQVQWAVQ